MRHVGVAGAAVALVVGVMVAPPMGGGVALAAPGGAVPCDFDGDGFADLAVSVAGEDLRGVRDAGAVQVLYGSATGVTARDQLWHQGRRGVKGALEKEDHFGAALVCGDFDADGYADLAIGAPDENVGSIRDAGIVQVLYGGPSGLTARDQVWHQGKPGVPGTNEAGDRFGSRLAVGDFDGDGYADLAVAIPEEDVGSVNDAGTVTVLRGSGSGLTATGSVKLRQGSNGMPSQPGRYEQFGTRLAAGDVNGDGRDDLVVVGEWDADFLASGYADLDEASSPVHVIFGSPVGLDPTGSQYFSPEALGFTRYTYVGQMTVADLNGDGLDDLAAWLYQASPSVARIVVLHGQRTGLHIGPLPSATTPGVDGLLSVPEGYGGNLVATEFNGDGVTDLVVSNRTREGRSFLVFLGTGTGLGTTFIESELAAFGWAGYDGLMDALPLSGGTHEWLVLGAPGGEVRPGLVAGWVGVLHGTAAGTAGRVALWHQDSPGIKGGAEVADWFGASVGTR